MGIRYLIPRLPNQLFLSCETVVLDEVMELRRMTPSGRLQSFAERFFEQFERLLLVKAAVENWAFQNHDVERPVSARKQPFT